MCVYSSVVVFVDALPESPPERQEAADGAVDKELVVSILSWFMLLGDVF